MCPCGPHLWRKTNPNMWIEKCGACNNLYNMPCSTDNLWNCTPQTHTQCTVQWNQANPFHFSFTKKFILSLVSLFLWIELETVALLFCFLIILIEIADAWKYQRTLLGNPYARILSNLYSYLFPYKHHTICLCMIFFLGTHPTTFQYNKFHSKMGSRKGAQRHFSSLLDRVQMKKMYTWLLVLVWLCVHYIAHISVPFHLPFPVGGRKYPGKEIEMKWGLL